MQCLTTDLAFAAMIIKREEHFCRIFEHFTHLHITACFTTWDARHCLLTPHQPLTGKATRWDACCVAD